jgi:hypothetical protein
LGPLWVLGKTSGAEDPKRTQRGSIGEAMRTVPGKSMAGVVYALIFFKLGII